MRVLRSDQLVRKLGKISDRQFASVNVAVMEFLAETNPIRPVRSKFRPTTIHTPLPRPALAPRTFQPTYTLKFR